MWPFMLAALGSGARVVTYDGSPFYPDVREFLKFISEQRFVLCPVKTFIVAVLMYIAFV